MIHNHSGKTLAIPAITNTLIIFLQLTVFLALCCVAAKLHPGRWLLPLALAFGVLMNSVYSVIHEAEHGMLFPHRRANDTAGVLLALLFPAPYHLLRQGHLGHHLRNRSDDEAFDLYFDGDNKLWRWVVYFGIITGFYWVMIALANPILLLAPRSLYARLKLVDRPSEAFVDSLNPRYHFLIRSQALAAILLHILIVWAFGIPLLNYAAMYLGFGWMWSSMQYVHHYGTQRHVTRGAHNLWLWAPIDLIWLHHNWHLTHHQHPTVPWVHLPRLSVQDVDAPPRGFLPLAYLKMWLGPQRATQRVKNKYAGQIIQ
jgi:fatty acid desaturase